MVKDQYKIKREKRLLRHRRVRAKISGTPERPRLAVFRSGAHIYAQLIDDYAGKVLLSVSDLDIKKGTKSERAAEVGNKIAQKAKELGIKKVSFDRGGFQYHGRVKSLAEAARAGGLEF